MANRRSLRVPVCAGEQDPGLRAGRADHHPALRTPVIRERRRVLHELEAEHSDEEVDRLVVVVDDDGHLLQIHPPTLLHGGIGHPRAYRASSGTVAGVSRSRFIEVPVEVRRKARVGREQLGNGMLAVADERVSPWT
jgi:hypothetical protein